MSKCNVCKNEKILCICPKGLGGGGAGETKEKETQEDIAYYNTVTQVSTALLKQYTEILKSNPSEIPEFINNIRTVLNNKSADFLLDLLREGVVTSQDHTVFMERFKNLNPNMAMLDALSHKFVLGVFTSPSNQLIAGIKHNLQKFEGWLPYPDTGGNFQQALLVYATYYEKLSPENQTILSGIFWDQIYKLGTPIIESNPEKPAEFNVYFLMRKHNLDESKEVPSTKKDLYLQGDFHGYGTTDGRQMLLELSNTGIMWRKDNIPKDYTVVYKYIQVEPSYRGIKPVPEHAPFFRKEDEGFVVLKTNVAAFPNIPQVECKDEYSKHTAPFPDFDDSERLFPASAERAFRVNTDTKQAYIPGKPIDWPSLMSIDNHNNLKHFVYHATLYSDKNGDLKRAEEKVTKKYHDALNFSDQTMSPYADITRDIQVFKPATGTVDNLVVVNDGIPYLIAGILDHFEKMVKENKLSPNTVFVFVHALPGLKKHCPPEIATALNKDLSANSPGMGVRLIDYKHGINDYIDFIEDKLLPKLEEELNVPKDPSHRVMIGSSLSGTASIYIGLTRPDLFGAVIAQSPSPDNRAILSEIPKEILPARHIHLSCGLFEHPDFAAANDNIDYARELSSKLDIKLHEGKHGHQFVAWTEALEQSLPDTINKMQHRSKLDNVDRPRHAS